MKESPPSGSLVARGAIKPSIAMRPFDASNFRRQQLGPGHRAQPWMASLQAGSGGPVRPREALPAPRPTGGAIAEPDSSCSVTNAMTVGLLFLESLSSGVITQSELSWLTQQQDSFSRVEEATALRLGRLLDQGEVQLGCRLSARR